MSSIGDTPRRMLEGSRFNFGRLRKLASPVEAKVRSPKQPAKTKPTTTETPGK